MLALSSPALLLGVACAVTFSASDYFRKAVPTSCSTPLVLFYIVGLQMPATIAWIFISGDAHLAGDYWLPGIIDGASGLVANLLFIAAIRRSPLSLMVPLLALVPVLAIVFAGVLLGEWPTLRQGLGMALVTAGLLVIFLPSEGAFDLKAAWRNLVREPGTRFMTGVILLWSATPALDKMCVERSSVGVHGLLQLAMLWSAILVWVLARDGVRGLRISRAAMGPLVGAGATASVAYIMQLAAYNLTLVAVVELLKRVLGMVGSVVFGRVLFKESLSVGKVVGITIVAVGLPLVILS